VVRKIWNNFEEGALCLLLVVMVLVTFVTVITRYVFDYPLSYIDQLVPNLLVWVTFLGSSAAVKRRAHLGLSMLYDLFPGKVRYAVDLAILAGTCAFFAVTAWYGGVVVALQMENRMMASLGYPSWLVGLAVPVGSGLFVVRAVEAWWRYRRGMPGPVHGAPAI
jgi:TRAP-type C4-dicarboxylate transport system permease small subunit